MRRWTLALGVACVGVVCVVAAVLRSLAPPRFAVPERRTWVFEDVTLVEPHRAPQPGRRLRIEDGVIAAAAPSSPTADRGDTPDLAGLYVAPGLADLHVHYPPSIAIGQPELWSLLLLAHGVTSVRETGSIDGTVFEVRRAIRAGRFPGPRIFACGEMLDGESPSFPSNRVVATPEAGRVAVREMAARGADCVKVYNELTPDTLAAIREAAAETGLPVIGHAPHSVMLEEAGIVDLQHGTGTVVVDRARVGRMDFRDADWATVDEDRLAHVARVSLDQGIAHTPTLVNAAMRELLLDPARARRAMERDTGLRHLPSFWPDVWAAIWGPPFVVGDLESEAQHALFRTRQIRMTTRLYEAGVRIHAGTDTLMPFVAPGSSLLAELVALVDAGIAAPDVFEIATREAGRALGVPGLGTLAVGAPADLVFLRSDPTTDVAAFREIEAVVADGRLYRRADLDAMLAASDAHFHGALYSGVMSAVVALVRDGFAPDRSSEVPRLARR